MEITEKEFAVIKEISGNHLPDQRTISHRTGISLGLTNLIIKRLITKGYIKATQLNRKKIQYMLTPKGFSEKADKSYRFALKTITHFRMLKDNIQNILPFKKKPYLSLVSDTQSVKAEKEFKVSLKPAAFNCSI